MSIETEYRTGWREMWDRKKGIKAKRIQPEDIESQTIRNGIKYTKLKPGTAVGAETVELWRNFRMCGR